MRRVVGWTFSPRPGADLVVQALEMAYEQRGRPQGLLFHSDKGAQYASRKFRQRPWRCRIQQSMSRRGNCWDNSPMERLFRSFRTEWLPSVAYMSAQEAHRDISHYRMHRHNWIRPHQFIAAASGSRPPVLIRFAFGFGAQTLACIPRAWILSGRSYRRLARRMRVWPTHSFSRRSGAGIPS